MIKSKYATVLLFIFVFFQFSFVISQDNFPQESPSNENFHERPEYDENFFLVDPSSKQVKEQDTSKQVKEQDTFQGKFLNMLFILGLLIGFMILASWLLKKMMKSRMTQINQASGIKILETRQLSPKSVLYLIEVEGETLLIGESAASINHLASFPIAVETNIPPFPKSN